MAYGITPGGFVIKTFEVIVSEIRDAIKASTAWGNAVNLNSDSPLGQLVSIFAEREALIWELAQDIYNSQYPDTSSDVSLDNVCQLIGVERLGKSESIVTAILSGTPGTLIEANKVAAVDPGGAQFYNVEDVTIELGGTVEAEFRSSELGAIPAPATTLKNIITKVSGWDSITNPEDADLGEVTESDFDLRLRRLQSLQIGGKSTLGGIFANLLQTVDGVTAVLVVENDSDEIDADGRPPKSIECIVKGGEDQDILDAIFALKAAGIETAATSGDIVEGIVIDSEGYPHTVKFSRPTDIETWFHTEIEVDGNFFNVGSKQKDRINILSAVEGFEYSITIQGTTFSYIGQLGDTKADIAQNLFDEIDIGDWVPVIPDYTALNEYLETESTYSGNDYNVSVTGLDSEMDIDSITLNTGDAIAVKEAILAYAETAQNIGVDVIRSKYYTPINLSNSYISSINIRLSETRWIGSPSGGETNIPVKQSEIGDLDTTRTTIEVTSV